MKKRFNWLTVLHGWGGLTIMAEGERGSEACLTWSQARVCEQGNCPFIKLPGLMRLIHYCEKSTGETCPHDSILSHQLPPMASEDYNNLRRDLVETILVNMVKPCLY